MPNDERGWFEVIWERLQVRRDLLAGVIFLTVAMTTVIAIGARSLGVPVQILLVAVGMVPNMLVILGMIYDCADADVTPDPTPSGNTAAH